MNTRFWDCAMDQNDVEQLIKSLDILPFWKNIVKNGFD